MTSPSLAHCHYSQYPGHGRLDQITSAGAPHCLRVESGDRVEGPSKISQKRPETLLSPALHFPVIGCLGEGVHDAFDRVIMSTNEKDVVATIRLLGLFNGGQSLVEVVRQGWVEEGLVGSTASRSLQRLQ